MGLVSGIAGMFMGGDSADAFNGINTPDPEAMKLALEEYVQQGILTPEDAKAILQDPSAFEQIISDPRFKEAQMKALTGLQEVADEGGLTATSRARMNDIAKNENVRERGAREAILSNAAERGISGSGLELMAQLKNQQESAGRVSDRDTQVAADAEQRALEALIQGGNMAGDIRGQDFDEATRIAAAKDEINRFNTANRNEFGMYNTGVRNAAQAANLGAKQSIADRNVGVRNTEQQYNKGVYQTDFDNKLRKATGQSAAQARDDAQRLGAIGEIEGGAADLISGAYTGLKKKKKDIGVLQ